MSELCKSVVSEDSGIQIPSSNALRYTVTISTSGLVDRATNAKLGGPRFDSSLVQSFDIRLNLVILVLKST